MGELTNQEIMEKVPFVLTFLIEWVLPIILLLVGKLIKFWLRKDKDFYWHKMVFYKYPSLYYKKDYTCFENTDGDQGVFSLIVAPFITYLIFFICFALYFATGTVLYTAAYLIGLALFIFGPRFVIDMIKALKYNKNTGDLERIDQLQREMDELKSKIN